MSYNLEDDLLRFLGPLVRIEGDKPRFVHQTVKDFLLDTKPGGNASEDLWYHVSRTESHLLMAKSCLQFLCLDDYLSSTPLGAIECRRNLLDWKKWDDLWILGALSPFQTSPCEGNGKSTVPTLCCAIRLWHSWSCRSSESLNRLVYRALTVKVEQIERFVQLLDAAGGITSEGFPGSYNIFRRIFDYNSRIALHITAAFGFAEASQLLISNGVVCVDEMKQWDADAPFRALHWATICGHV
jgi:hypothetical protein